MLRDKKIQFEVYKCIAKSVENKNPSDKLGLTPLHIATKVENHDICRYILEQLRNEYLSDQKKEKVSDENSNEDLEVEKQLFATYWNKKYPRKTDDCSIPSLYKQIEDAIGFLFRHEYVENDYLSVDTQRYDGLHSLNLQSFHHPEKDGGN